MKKKIPSPVPASPALLPRSRRTSLVLGAAAFLSMGTACASDDGDSESGEGKEEAPQAPPEDGSGGGDDGSPQAFPSGGDGLIPPQVPPQVEPGDGDGDGTGGAGAPQYFPSGGNNVGTGGAGAPQTFPDGGSQDQGTGGDEAIPPQPAPSGGDTNDL